MPTVFQSYLEKKPHRNIKEEFFTGTYEECVIFWNEKLTKFQEEYGNELYIRSYPSSHKSLEAVWNERRLVLCNWE